MSLGLILLLLMTAFMASARISCPPGRYECPTGKGHHCPDKAYVCDGHEDCVGGYDEDDCHGRCAASAMDCGDGRCVPAAFWCDGHRDCRNGEDEKQCTPQDKAKLKLVDFRARAQGRVIANDSWYATPEDLLYFDRDKPRTRDAAVECDGHIDAFRATDEVHCRGCRAGAFFCGMTTDRGTRYLCLPAARRCDGIDNCVDGEDEEGCTSTTVSTTSTTTEPTTGLPWEPTTTTAAANDPAKTLPVHAWLSTLGGRRGPSHPEDPNGDRPPSGGAVAVNVNINVDITDPGQYARLQDLLGGADRRGRR